MTEHITAPTKIASQALQSEGIPDTAIRITGNTVIDTLLWVREIVKKTPPDLPNRLAEAIDKKRVILVTAHRRESFDGGLKQICLALQDLTKLYSDLCIIYPVHPNPNVREPVYDLLYDKKGICLVDPLPYEAFVWLMDKAYLILTDSGGVQEEAPSLGKPVLVTRNTTERPEAISVGAAKLVETDSDKIIMEATKLLNDPASYRKMSEIQNPYGDGKA